MWGYKWEGIYSRRTNQSKTNNMFRGKLMKPVLLQLFFYLFGNMNHNAQLRKQIQEVRSSLHGASSQ